MENDDDMVHVHFLWHDWFACCNKGVAGKSEGVVKQILENAAVTSDIGAAGFQQHNASDNQAATDSSAREKVQPLQYEAEMQKRHSSTYGLFTSSAAVIGQRTIILLCNFCAAQEDSFSAAS